MARFRVPLTPFPLLVRVSPRLFGHFALLQAEAQRADRECRKALKERLIERVNIIQRRLDAENEKLQKKQQEFQRNRDQVEGAEEEFEKFCAEAMFRIGILEQRLQRQVGSTLLFFCPHSLLNSPTK